MHEHALLKRTDQKACRVYVCCVNRQDKFYHQMQSKLYDTDVWPEIRPPHFRVIALRLSETSNPDLHERNRAKDMRKVSGPQNKETCSVHLRKHWQCTELK